MRIVEHFTVDRLGRFALCGATIPEGSTHSSRIHPCPYVCTACTLKWRNESLEVFRYDVVTDGN